MIWPYFTPNTFYLSTTPVILVSTNSNIQPNSIKNPSNPENTT